MFGMGMGELLLILVVALLFVGPDKLPQAAKAIGKGIRDFRKHSQDLQNTLEQDEKLGEAVRELKSALRDDPLRPRPAPRPRPAAPPAELPATPVEGAAAPELPAPPPVIAAAGAIAKERAVEPADDPAPRPKSDDSAHG